MHPSQKSIESAAAEWAGRRDGGLSESEEAEFALWLRADPRHAQAVGELEAASLALDRLSSLRRSEDAEPDPDLALRAAPPRARRAWAAIAMAAAAALAFAYFGSHYTREAAPFARTASTEVGGLQKISLPDGSVLDLNTDSSVEIRYTARERDVRLVRGEAKFTVAKNPSRPFVVEAGGVAVRAVGTAFNVRLRQDSLEVLVTEGRVGMNDLVRGTSLIAAPSPGTVAPVVSAGHRAVVHGLPHASELAPAVVAAVPPAKISQLLAWEDRQIEFDPTPLGALVAEFNRYNRHKLVVADPAIAGLKVGGSFRVDDCDAFVRLLESSFGIAAERAGGETLLRGRR